MPKRMSRKEYGEQRGQKAVFYPEPVGSLTGVSKRTYEVFSLAKERVLREIAEDMGIRVSVENDRDRPPGEEADYVPHAWIVLHDASLSQLRPIALRAAALGIADLKLGFLDTSVNAERELWRAFHEREELGLHEVYSDVIYGSYGNEKSMEAEDESRRRLVEESENASADANGQHDTAPQEAPQGEEPKASSGEGG